MGFLKTVVARGFTSEICKGFSLVVLHRTHLSLCTGHFAFVSSPLEFESSWRQCPLSAEFYPNVSDGGLTSSAFCNGFDRCPTYQAVGVSESTSILDGQDLLVFVTASKACVSVSWLWSFVLSRASMGLPQLWSSLLCLMELTFMMSPSSMATTLVSRSTAREVVFLVFLVDFTIEGSEKFELWNPGCWIVRTCCCKSLHVKVLSSSKKSRMKPDGSFLPVNAGEGVWQKSGSMSWRMGDNMITRDFKMVMVEICNYHPLQIPVQTVHKTASIGSSGAVFKFEATTCLKALRSHMNSWTFLILTKHVLKHSRFVSLGLTNPWEAQVNVATTAAPQGPLRSLTRHWFQTARKSCFSVDENWLGSLLKQTCSQLKVSNHLKHLVFVVLAFQAVHSWKSKCTWTVFSDMVRRW